MATRHIKDEILNRLAASANVAQFISFDDRLRQRYAWLHGFEPNHRFETGEQAVQAMLDASPEKSVNVRTFEADDPKSREFVYGLHSTADVFERLHAFSAEGLTTIVNETIDVADGGVSGVAYGDLVEFAPGDTPRCVEKPAVAALPRTLAMRLLSTVYGFTPDIPGGPTDRVEFSIHPLRRGYRDAHTIVWEIEPTGFVPTAAPIRWPNRFSRFIGDKAFGLLVAELLGLPVPATTAFTRHVAPFAFGAGGSAEPWLRTCPTEQVPGKFTTTRGWIDPFALMAREDPEGTAIASILHQRGIDALSSGAAVEQADGTLLVEGVHGFGDAFMTGERAPDRLDPATVSRVQALYEQIRSAIGAARFEWVDDGKRTWVVQLHCGATISRGATIVPGDPPAFRRFEVVDGLKRLRQMIQEVARTGDGIVVVGEVGLTSHVGDVLRKAGIPSRLEGPT